MRKRFNLAQARLSPKAEAIAAAILEHSAILNLRTPRLIRDICERFQVCRDTALAALALARQSA